jgi:cell division protease FtsH
MSERLGPIALLPRDDAERFPGASDLSPQTQAAVDEEVRRLIDDAHRAVTTLLTDHRTQLDSLAAALLSAETLDAPAAYGAAMVPLRSPANAVQPTEDVLPVT